MLGKTQKKYPILHNKLITSTFKAEEDEEVIWVKGEPFEAVLEYHSITTTVKGGRHRIHFINPETGIIYGFAPIEFVTVISKMEKGKLKGEFHVIKRGNGFAITWYEPHLSAAQALAREARKTKKRQAEAKENWKIKRREQKKILAEKRVEEARKKREKAAKHKLVVEERNRRRREARKLKAEEESVEIVVTSENKVVGNSLD